MTRAVTPSEDEGGSSRSYFAVVDLTDLRRQDRRVADLLERLQLATEASGVGTWERNDQTDEVRWDAITLNLFGLPVGSPAPDYEQYLGLVHPQDRERVRAEWASVEDGARSLDIEFRVLRPDGTERWLRSRGRVERNEQGGVVRRIGVCFDTTERRQAEVALQAQAMAEQANAAKTEFLSRMSHELRTPLNAVLGFAQLMALDHADPLSPGQLARVDHVQKAGWHLLALVNDVLDLAKIESRQAQLTYSRVPLAEVVNECIVMTAPLAAARQIQLCWLSGSYTPAQVWADRTRLKQVLLNLLSNGVKYNREGGRVEVRASRTESGLVQIGVLDTGLGLTPEQLRRLFEPFNRLGREVSGIDGSGIGLALSKLIVEQMGGRIDATSDSVLGSEFRVTLPGVADD
jgi:signal transduction histidine kinase